MALEVSRDVQHSVIREDHSIYLHELGIPGPYNNYIEKHLTVEKLLEIYQSLNDRTGHFQIATVYAEPNGKTYQSVFKVPFTLGQEIEKAGRGWNGLIRLNDETRALTEYPEKERVDIWNRGYQAIAEHLSL